MLRSLVIHTPLFIRLRKRLPVILLKFYKKNYQLVKETLHRIFLHKHPASVNSKSTSKFTQHASFHYFTLEIAKKWRFKKLFLVI